MAKTAQEVFDYLNDYIKNYGADYPKWYAGVASDPKVRLFTDHNVSQNYGRWGYDQCANDQGARAVEEAFIKLGCKGGGGGGDQSTTWAYVYEITSTTKE